jgi:uncharacterized membrane protein YgdD (TMEM256/DUF423 family)
MLRLASIFGILAVALGAFGAHGLKDVLEQNHTQEIWKTASLYHLVHSAILVLLALSLPKARKSYAAFALGILIFSGSLYLLALTNVRWLGAVTPVGGLALILGWLMLMMEGKVNR